MCMHVHVCLYACVSLCVHACVCLCVSMCACVHVCVRACVSAHLNSAKPHKLAPHQLDAQTADSCVCSWLMDVPSLEGRR